MSTIIDQNRDTYRRGSRHAAHTVARMNLGPDAAQVDVNAEAERIVAAERAWCERVIARGGNDLLDVLTAPLGTRWDHGSVRMPGYKSAEAARLHLTMFGHWPVNADGQTVTAAGSVVKAAACVTCHPHKVKRGKGAPARSTSTATTVEREAAQFMAERAAERVTVAEVAEVETTTNEERDDVSVPTDDERIRAYLDRLVHEPKRVYALEYVAHRVSGAPAPADPGAPWASKVRVKVDRMVRS